MAGFDAAAMLGRWLPLFWPLGLVASIPGVALVGRRAYNALAATRPRDVPCTDDTCALPVPPAASRSQAPARADAPGRNRS